MILDLRTVIFMASISCVLMAIVLVAASKVYPRSVGGLTHWGWGSLGFGVAGVLFALRDLAPQWLSILVANALFVGSYVAWWRGMRLLLGQPLSPRRNSYLAVLLVVAFLAYFTFVQPAIAPRLVLVSGISCVFFASMAWLVWRWGQRLRADLFFITLMVLGGLATLVRLVAAVMNPASTSALLTPSAPQMVYLMAYNLMALLDGIGFFLLATTRLQSELEQMANHDPLTGAMNRRALMQKLSTEVAVAQRKSQTMGLIAMDLDHFKRINDTHGHGGGDRVLRHFSELLSQTKRPQDLFARMGGEEFVLVLPDTDWHGTQLVAQRVHAALNGPRPEGELPYTCSFGVGIWTGRPASAGESQFPQNELDAWFKRVDDAVYRAKAAGRNCIELVVDNAE